MEAYIECSIPGFAKDHSPDSLAYRWIDISSFEDRTKNNCAALSQLRQIPLLLASFDENWPCCSPYSVRLNILCAVVLRSNFTQTTMPTVGYWTSLQSVRC